MALESILTLIGLIVQILVIVIGGAIAVSKMSSNQKMISSNVNNSQEKLVTELQHLSDSIQKLYSWTNDMSIRTNENTNRLVKVETQMEQIKEIVKNNKT